MIWIRKIVYEVNEENVIYEEFRFFWTTATADVDEVVFQIFDSDSDPSDYDEPPVIERKNTKKKTVVKRQAWDSDEIEEIDKYF